MAARNALLLLALAAAVALVAAQEVNLQELSAKNYYELIGVTKDVSSRELTRALRRAAAQFHPDTVRDENEKKKKEKVFLRIQKAQEVFDDPMMRRQYDKMIEHGIIDYDFDKLNEIIGGSYQPGSYDVGEHVMDSITEEDAGPMLTWGLAGLVLCCLLPVLYVQFNNGKRVSTGKLLKKQGVSSPTANRDQVEAELRAAKEAQERYAAENRRLEEEKASRQRQKQEEQQADLRRRKERDDESKKKAQPKKDKPSSPVNADARTWSAADERALEQAAASIAVRVPNRLALIVNSMNASAPKSAQPYTVQDIQKRLQAVDAALASAAAEAVAEDEVKAPPAAAKKGKKGGKKEDGADGDDAEWEKVERPKKKAEETKPAAAAAAGDAKKKKSQEPKALSPHSPPFEPSKKAEPVAPAAVNWTADELKALEAGLAAHPKSEAKRWESIAAKIPSKTPQQCQDRAREQAERLKALYDV